MEDNDSVVLRGSGYMATWASLWGGPPAWQWGTDVYPEHLCGEASQWTEQFGTLWAKFISV